MIKRTNQQMNVDLLSRLGMTPSTSLTSQPFFGKRFEMLYRMTDERIEFTDHEIFRLEVKDIIKDAREKFIRALDDDLLVLETYKPLN